MEGWPSPVDGGGHAMAGAAGPQQGLCPSAMGDCESPRVLGVGGEGETANALQQVGETTARPLDAGWRCLCTWVRGGSADPLPQGLDVEAAGMP